MIDPDDHTPTADLFEKYVAPTYGRFPIRPAHGEGAILWDEHGKRYLDFGAGIAVSSLGHAHKALTAVFRGQPKDLIHSSNLYQPRGQALLAKTLVENVVGFPGKVFFSNSGAEANEALIKLARKFGQAVPKANGEPRREVITFGKSFHGRTTGGMAATAQEKIRLGFGPLMEGFNYLPFNDVDALRDGITEDTVAILLEPVQGEGGINVATADFLTAAADICRERDILLLFDEVQCGIGRCGTMNGWHAVGGTEAIVPDAISWAKGMGGGYPVGAAWFKDRPAGDVRLCELLGPGTHGSTYGGSPLASAVASAVIGSIIDDGLVAHAGAMGEKIIAVANGWETPLITEVRGRGLMLGFQLDADAVAKCAGFEDSGRTPALFVIDALHEAGVLTVPAGADVVRWLPALVVTEEQIDEALEIFEAVLQRIAG